jgi:pSer/pThr/pTyr-binding forkhead associated (FHA) protein
MEPTPNPLTDPPSVAARSVPQGELIVQNGRLAGTRRLLTVPLTLLGRAAGCDVRLNVEGVQPLHCALVRGPEGWVLRELPGGSPTLVNGQPAGDGPLQDGDVLTVGPFRFQLQQLGGTAATEAANREREKEALRIQAAAVAAQQAALTEEEFRLEQRRAALGQQEEQLAAHLEEKRQRLIALRDETRQAQQALKQERAAHDRRVALVTREMAQTRREITDGQRQVRSERRRVLALRYQLKRRWHRHWAAERATLRQQEAANAGRQRHLEREEERLRQERATFESARLRLNGEAELTRRQLQKDREHFHQEQEEVRQRARLLDQQAAALAEAEERRLLEQRRWDSTCLDLKCEADGLESRIKNYRRKILDQEQEVHRLETVIRELQTQQAAPTGQAAASPAPLVEAAPAPAPLEQRAWQLQQAETDLGERLAALERLAGELADQRLYLAEECARLAQAQQRWQQERQAAAAELEALGQRLHEQEQALRVREQALEVADYGVRHRAEELDGTQRLLEAWKARLAVAVTDWETERERLLAEVRSREERVERRFALAADLHERWQRRRRRQVLGLRARRLAYEELRQEALAVREEGRRRAAQLEREQRALAEQGLALEQYRHECVARSAHPAVAVRRLDRLRRRWAALSAASQRQVNQERARLEAEASRLEEQGRRLREQTDEITAHEADLSRRQAEWEAQRAREEAEQDRLRQEVRLLHQHRDQDEHRLAALREEVERLARLLLGEGDTIRIPLGRAA